MKKIFTIALMAVAAIAAKADGLYVGGNVGFMHQDQQTEYGKVSTNEFSIIPEIGYNLNKSWAIGTTIGYDYTHWNGTDTDLHMFEFNPYARWSYFRTSNNLVQLFIDGGAGIGCGTYEYKDDDSHTAVTWNVGLRPGIAINFTDKFSFVTHIGFLGYQGANNAAYDAGMPRKGGFSFSGNDLTFGFYYNF